MPNKKRCFVVMGFGIKTDFATGRKLDLDKSYKLLIKPVVEQQGLTCIRADEIRHSGSIEVPMYQELLNADVVIADLSTANLNAFYELGIRHALRPHTTIVVSEKLLPYPFDINHIKITSYTHLGDAIDYDEVMRFRDDLGKTLAEVMAGEKTDSPIYTFLDLIPPTEKQVLEAVEQSTRAAKPKKKDTSHNQTLSLVIDQAEEALKKKQYAKAKGLFNSALLISKHGSEGNETTPTSNNSYLVHRVALATYKANEPDQITALNEAISILDDLDLAHTNDSQTVVLAGKIEKRLYTNNQGEHHLANAIQYYERAFYLLNNRYNGINLAFLYNHRATLSTYTKEQDIIADLVLANRVRQQVLAMCKREEEKTTQTDTGAKLAVMQENDELAAAQKELEEEQKFWIMVNKAEAYFGIGNFEEYKKSKAEAELLLPKGKDWMMKAFTNQVSELRKLMAKTGHLLDPVWDGKD